jgi:hypothetical protein
MSSRPNWKPAHIDGVKTFETMGFGSSILAFSVWFPVKT